MQRAYCSEVYAVWKPGVLGIGWSYSGVGQVFFYSWQSTRHICANPIKLKQHLSSSWAAHHIIINFIIIIIERERRFEHLDLSVLRFWHWFIFYPSSYIVFCSVSLAALESFLCPVKINVIITYGIHIRHQHLKQFLGNHRIIRKSILIYLSCVGALVDMVVLSN